MVVSGKCIIRSGLRIGTGAERTTVVDIFDIIQQVRDLSKFFFVATHLFP